MSWLDDLLPRRHHKHACDHSNTPFSGQPTAVWEHPDLCAYVSTEVYDASHACPICSKETPEKYFGDKPAAYIGQCARPERAVLALPAGEIK